MDIRDLAPWWGSKETEERQGESNPLFRMHRDMDRMFDRLFKDVDFGPRWGVTAEGRLIPDMDVVETDKELEVTLDLPGLDEKDLDVNLTDGVLAIKGEKETEKEEKGKEYIRTERRHGAYYRAFRLPFEVDESKVTAQFTKGVLTVHLPKTESAQKKAMKIEVKAA